MLYESSKFHKNPFIRCEVIARYLILGLRLTSDAPNYPAFITYHAELILVTSFNIKVYGSTDIYAQTYLRDHISQ